MLNIIRRFSFGVPVRWFVMALVLLLVLAGFWLVPRVRGRIPQLQLVAIGQDGRFQQSVSIPAAWADSADPGTGAVSRFPLLLALRNEGIRPATPNRLKLSIPARYRITLPDGRAYEGRATDGNPLLQYSFSIRVAPVQPGRLPVGIPGLDSLFIEPMLPAYNCTVLSDDVPEFVPAPALDPATLSTVRIFYSLEGRRFAQRQTGLLTINLDPELLKQPAAPPIPSFPVTVNSAGIPLPEFAALRRVGSRESTCGAPGTSAPMLSTVWETMDNGRLYVLDYAGVPRKYLFDMNRDSIVELEMWDPDADGRFEISRPTRFPVPASVVPPPPTAPAPVAADTAIRGDSTVTSVPLAAGAVTLDALPRDSAGNLIILPPRMRAVVDSVRRAERMARDSAARAAERARPRGPRVLGRPYVPPRTPPDTSRRR